MALLAPTVATNMEFDMGTESELDMIKAALLVEYPLSEGWELWSDCLLEEVELAFLLRREGRETVAAVLCDGVFVRSMDLKMADQMKAYYKQRMDGQELHVMLVYRKLLFRPQRIPKGLSLMLLRPMEETSGQRLN